MMPELVPEAEMVLDAGGRRRVRWAAAPTGPTSRCAWCRGASGRAPARRSHAISTGSWRGVLPGRHHHDPRLRRQFADEPHHGRRGQPHLARDPRRRPQAGGQPRPGGQGGHGQGSGCAQRARRAGRRTPGDRDPGRPAQGGAARPFGHRRRRFDPDQRRRDAGGVLPRGRQRVPDHRSAPRRGPRPGRRCRQRVDQQPDRPGAPGEEPARAADAVRTDGDPAQEPGADHPRVGGAADDAERRDARGPGAAVAALRYRTTSPSDLAPRRRSRPAPSTSSEPC